MCEARTTVVRLFAIAADCRLPAELRAAALDAVIPFIADVLMVPPTRESEWRVQATLARLDARLSDRPLIHPSRYA